MNITHYLFTLLLMEGKQLTEGSTLVALLVVTAC